jgi:hypothetical protein
MGGTRPGAAPVLRGSPWLRDVALFVSASWFSVPLLWLGRARLRLRWAKAITAAMLTTVGSVTALRLLVQ